MKSYEEIKQALSPVRRGDPLDFVASSDRINALQDAVLFMLSGSWLKTGSGLRKGYSGGRISIRLGNVRGGGGSSDNSVWNYSATVEEDSATITFHDGLINNILASNVDVPIKLKSGKNYLFALAKGTGGQIESVQIILDQAMARGRLIEAKGAPPAEIPVFIALADYNSEEKEISVKRVRFRNVTAIPVESRRESRTPPSPGEEPFTRYYAWQLNDTP